MIPPLIAIFAFMCTFIANYWCETVKFETSVPSVLINGANVALPDVQLGPWYKRETQTIQVSTGGQTTIHAVDVCVAFSSTYVIDSKLKAVRAFSIIAPVIGGLLVIPLCFAPCFYFFSVSTWKIVAMLFLVIVTLFQGLTFLVLQSNACSVNPLLAEAPPGLVGQFAWETFIKTSYKSQCSWDAGSTTNVVAVVLWFLTGLAMLAVGVPTREPPGPVETQEVTYEKTVNPEDGTMYVAETGVVKGTAVPPTEETETAMNTVPPT